MKRLAKFFVAAGLALGGLTASADSTPLFVVTPSVNEPAQGQSATFLITPAALYPGYNIDAAVVLDGQSVPLQRTDEHSWMAVTGPYASLGAHDLSISLSLESSAGSTRTARSIRVIERRITFLHDEIDEATDLGVKKALMGDLANQERLLTTLEAKLMNLRTPIGSQNFSFTVVANTTDPNFPSVASVSPSVGGNGGGTNITISGTNFNAGAIVLVGGVTATNVTFVNSKTITATTAQGSNVGLEDIEVDLPPLANGILRNSVLARAFYAIPAATPIPGEAPVAISGGSQSLFLGQSAYLDGNQSFDWTGTALRFDWSLLSSPASSSLQPGQTFPEQSALSFTPDLNGVYVFQLIVTQVGTAGLVSAPSLAVVSVASPPEIMGPRYKPYLVEMHAIFGLMNWGYAKEIASWGRSRFNSP